MPTLWVNYDVLLKLTLQSLHLRLQLLHLLSLVLLSVKKLHKSIEHRLILTTQQVTLFVVYVVQKGKQFGVQIEVLGVKEIHYFGWASHNTLIQINWVCIRRELSVQNGARVGDFTAIIWNRIESLENV